MAVVLRAHSLQVVQALRNHGLQNIGKVGDAAGEDALGQYVLLL